MQSAEFSFNNSDSRSSWSEWETGTRIFYPEKLCRSRQASYCSFLYSHGSSLQSSTKAVRKRCWIKFNSSIPSPNCSQLRLRPVPLGLLKGKAGNGAKLPIKDFLTQKSSKSSVKETHWTRSLLFPCYFLERYEFERFHPKVANANLATSSSTIQSFRYIQLHSLCRASGSSPWQQLGIRTLEFLLGKIIAFVVRYICRQWRSLVT